MPGTRTRNTAKGLSLLDMVFSMAVFAVLTGPVLQLFVKTQRFSIKEDARLTQVQPVRAAFDQMMTEIRMAGYPAKNAFPPGVQAAYPGLVAAGFVTVTSTSVIFESDINFDGTVDRVEYTMHPLSPAADEQYCKVLTPCISRKVYPKARNGTIGDASSVQDYFLPGTSVTRSPFIPKLADATPVFTWEINPASPQAFPRNVKVVYISLALRLTPDPLKPTEYETMVWSGAARRANPSQ